MLPVCLVDGANSTDLHFGSFTGGLELVTLDKGGGGMAESADLYLLAVPTCCHQVVPVCAAPPTLLR